MMEYITNTGFPEDVIFPVELRKAPHHKGETLFLLLFLHLNLHPAGQPEDDPVLAVHRHAVDQPGPLRLIKLGVQFRQGFDGFDEPLQLPPAHHSLADSLYHRTHISAYWHTGSIQYNRR